MQFHRLNTLAAFVLGALAAQGAIAQNVVFSNSTNTSVTPNAPYTIPLQAGVPVTVAPNGDIRATCQLDGATQRCVGIPAPGTGGGPIDPTKPTVTIGASLADSDPSTPDTVDIPANTTFSLNVNPTLAQNCLRSSSPSISSWDGSVLPGQAGATLSLGPSSTVQFSVKCYNDAGSGSASPITIVTAEGQVEPPPDSTEPAACANVRPHNYTRATTKQLITGTSAGSPIRQVTSLREFYGGTISTTKYYFAMSAGEYAGMRFTGAELEADLPGRTSYAPGGEAQSGQPSTGMLTITISKCAGDFRSPSSVGDGLLLCHGDSMRAPQSDVIAFTIGDTEQARISNLANLCRVDRNTTYYMNILFVDTTDGITPNPPGEVSCGAGETQCGTRFNLE